METQPSNLNTINSKHNLAAKIVGVVNITEDSFSDGGKFLLADAAIKQALLLQQQGADIIELGPASSHPDASNVSAEEEIRRLQPVVETLVQAGCTLSLDSFQAKTQQWALEQGFSIINDIKGFKQIQSLDHLAASNARLVLMYSLHQNAQATREQRSADEVKTLVNAFFEQQIAKLNAAGISNSRIILDPGMGFFLGSNPQPSLTMLNQIQALKLKFSLPVMIAVSRKSFLGKLTGRPTAQRDAASLAAECYAALSGADFLRTHNVANLRDALTVLSACVKHAH